MTAAYINELSQVMNVNARTVSACVKGLASLHKTSVEDVVKILRTHFNVDHLGALPLEIRFLIAQGLPIKDVISLCSSSKSLLEICDVWQLWAAVMERDYGVKAGTDAKEKLKKVTQLKKEFSTHLSRAKNNKLSEQARQQSKEDEINLSKFIDSAVWEGYWLAGPVLVRELFNIGRHDYATEVVSAQEDLMVGLVLLKKNEEALRLGDVIYAEGTFVPIVIVSELIESPEFLSRKTTSEIDAIFDDLTQNILANINNKTAESIMWTAWSMDMGERTIERLLSSRADTAAHSPKRDVLETVEKRLNALKKELSDNPKTEKWVLEFY